MDAITSMAANAVGGLTVRHRETTSLIVAARHGTYHADKYSYIPMKWNEKCNDVKCVRKPT